MDTAIKLNRFYSEISSWAYLVLLREVNAQTEIELLRKYSLLTLPELVKLRGCGPVTAIEIIEAVIKCHISEFVAAAALNNAKTYENGIQ